MYEICIQCRNECSRLIEIAILLFWESGWHINHRRVLRRLVNLQHHLQYELYTPCKAFNLLHLVTSVT